MSVMDDVRQLVSGPCDAPAGSRRKRQFLAFRARFGLPLWHPGDCREVRHMTAGLESCRGRRIDHRDWKDSGADRETVVRDTSRISHRPMRMLDWMRNNVEKSRW